MPKQSTDYLIQLIKSLTKSEKRHFRLFVRRNQASEDILFLQLFDFLEKNGEYDEARILKTIPDIKKRQLSNLKAHLYKQLLISLRLLNKNYDEEIDNRERIDFAKVLYNKGLYRQSLEILERVKKRSIESKQTSLIYEIVEFEKLIEGQYVTGSVENRGEIITEESTEYLKDMVTENEYSSLAMRLYALYLKVGYVRDEKDYVFVKNFFQSNLPKHDYDDLSFMGKIYWCQSYAWYHFISQDFLNCYRYGQRWVDLFEENQGMIQTIPSFYINGLHNLLSSLANLTYYEKFTEILDRLEAFPEQFNIKQIKNIEGLYHLYYYIHIIKKHFMDGTFREGLEAVSPLKKLMKRNPYNWDERRLMVFNYRLACLHFGAGDFDPAIDYLNLIINQKSPDYREDIQSFARILNLIAHFEMGNDQLVEYQVKSVYRFLSKMEDLHEIQKEIFRFVRKLSRIRREELPEEFIKLKSKLEKIRHKPYEARAFLYLDIISWLESKIEDKSMQEVVQTKFAEGRNIYLRSEE